MNSLSVFKREEAVKLAKSVARMIPGECVEVGIPLRKYVAEFPGDFHQ